MCTIFAPRRRHELVEDRGRQLACPLVELCERVVEMAADEPLGAAEPLERRGAQRLRARAALLLPQTRHHELQERRRDAEVAAWPFVSTAPAPVCPSAMLPARTCSSTASTSSGSTV